MASFSWSDSIQAAVGSCLPCFRSSDSDGDDADHQTLDGAGIRRARSDELEGLLADAGDTDTEAETLSLHSNIGSGAGQRKRRQRRGFPKHITVLGWNLFGRPPIQLPDDEGSDALNRRTRRRPGTISTTTLDSDAAALDSSAIEGMSAAQMDARAAAAEAAAEEERRQKEERRRRRRERKALKEAAKSIALGGQEEFEGFPGSGSAYPHIPSPFHRAPASQSEVFGPYMSAPVGDAEADEDAADLGGELYVRKTTDKNSNGSDSRSRTSASQSDVPHYNHHYASQMSPHMVPLPPSTRSRSDSSSLVPSSQPKKSRKSKSSKKSSSSTSQSQSLPSPVQPNMPFVGSPDIVSPANERLQPMVFEGYPEENTDAAYGGFPSAGFGGARGKSRDMGAFLAHRGDA
ncbi:hypothetical protein PLICRDRAFT_51536 [Plicaturopsis crispa FD-325 SS-3]|nr:hypothetical protein PLICRDRAFT_51536 [Plicaturopsis crispa FD-325 SS-3]